MKIFYRIMVISTLLFISACSPKLSVRHDGRVVQGDKVANGIFLDSSNSETYNVIVVEEGIVVEEISYKSKLFISKKLFSVRYYRDTNNSQDNRDIIFYDTTGREFLRAVIRENKLSEGSYREYDNEFNFSGESGLVEDLGQAYNIGMSYIKEKFNSY